MVENEITFNCIKLKLNKSKINEVFFYLLLSSNQKQDIEQEQKKTKIKIECVRFSIFRGFFFSTLVTFRNIKQRENGAKQDK